MIYLQRPSCKNKTHVNDRDVCILSTFLGANINAKKKYFYHYKTHFWEKIFWTDAVAFKALVQFLQVLYNSSLLLIIPQLFLLNQKVIVF